MLTITFMSQTFLTSLYYLECKMYTHVGAKPTSFSKLLSNRIAVSRDKICAVLDSVHTNTFHNQAGRLKQFILFVLAIRINTFYGLIWWCRTNVRTPSSSKIGAPPTKRPLLLHLKQYRLELPLEKYPIRIFVKLKWDYHLSPFNLQDNTRVVP